MQWKKERKEVIRFAKRTYKKQLVTGLSGNLSLRVNEDFIIITPRAKCYEKLSLEDLVVLDLKGNIIEGQKEPSSEKNLHLEIYRVREDVRAIIHTHSSYASVFAALQIPIPVILDEQTEILGGTIAVTNYAPSGSLELAKEAVKTLNKSKAILLAKHGAVAVGSSLVEAFHVCELVEKLSKIYLFMKLVQEKIPFSR
ncbi:MULTISPECIES: class II aldolase/adducin family protein [Thermodesulfovibrio]|jgi:L-ribulose-5-phosphate 4-epimerase|uniref:class II aldolase/adducin family protein n=1 Tax=Thermodesulfovibrio TaxID=28261 RepID=UPI0026058B17|nr:class II aldolase/adducin family protein [Thermodesulfovibrio sp.]